MTCYFLGQKGGVSEVVPGVTQHISVINEFPPPFVGGSGIVRSYPPGNSNAIRASYEQDPNTLIHTSQS